MVELLYAQQSFRLPSSAQSAFAVQRRSTKGSGFWVLPQLVVGGPSEHDVWQLDDSEATEQAPRRPPSSTSDPQHTVPLPHWPVPVLPRQSSAAAGEVQTVAHVCVLEVGS